MKREKMRFLILIAILATALFSGLIVQASPENTTAEEPQIPAKRPLSPMMVEIETMMGQKEVRLEELYAELAGAPDAVMALEINRKIEAVKVSAERSLLSIQLEFAKTEGTPEQVEALEAALVDFDAPRERYVPTATPEGSGVQR